MDTPRKTPRPAGHAVTKEVAVSEFVGVMGKLKAIIEEENDHLSRGLPATLLETTQAKVELSNEYGALGSELADGVSGPILNDSVLQEKLLAATSQLYAMTEANRELLCDALAATRRRVDRVMEAIRLHDDAEDAEEVRDLRPRRPL